MSVTLGCSDKDPRELARLFQIGRYSPWLDTPEPFSINVNMAAFSGAYTTYPERAFAPVSVPVLAWRRSLAVVSASRSRSVPVCPAIAKPLPNTPKPPSRSRIDVSSAHVARLPRSSPEPSTITSPSMAKPISCNVVCTTCAPASLVPADSFCKPISFSISSAVLLSLFVSISSTMAVNGAEFMLAITGRSTDAVPTFALPRTTIPRSLSKRKNSCAADSAG